MAALRGGNNHFLGRKWSIGEQKPCSRGAKLRAFAPAARFMPTQNSDFQKIGTDEKKDFKGKLISKH